MSRFPSWGLVALLLPIGLLVGCDASPQEASPEAAAFALSVPDGSPVLLQAEARRDGLTLDAALARVAERMPGFAGVYVDAEDRLHVRLRDTGRSADAVAALASVFGADRITAREIVTEPAAHSFAELDAWRDRARSVFVLDGVVSLDLDERRGRVVVGVESEADQELVEARLAALDVPREVSEVVVEGPIVATATLSSTVRPRVGGLKIVSGGQACSLGFNATLGGTDGFVTASHCTGEMGVSNGVGFSQGSNSIGNETVDPPFFTHAEVFDCFVGFECRWSDAAFADYSVESYPGVARTTSRGRVTGSVTFPSMDNVFNVMTYKDYPFVGEPLDKMGWRTGWTYGNVERACIDREYPEADRPDTIMLCQGLVDAGGDEGDSGGTVFRLFQDRETSGRVIVYGVTWAVTEDKRKFFFSPMVNIFDDFERAGHSNLSVSTTFGSGF